MAILLKNLDILEWLWHDADIYKLQASWSDNGEILVNFRCEINPEESRQPLFDLGIKTSIVDVQFRNVWRLKTDFVGDMASREVILDWCVIEPSPLISQIRNNGAATDIDLFHHQIKGSGGSTVDIVFEQIWLEQAISEMKEMTHSFT
ncbi:hypothetical protein [Microseira sp. BLCC-F43]|jgi:hypothetical protein|uniref:hypothetical protein n=1 Tax=Microseira sp. BLCC-F43 TaxID=3153602 RepID=UPI0035B9F2DD